MSAGTIFTIAVGVALIIVAVWRYHVEMKK